MDWKLWGAIFAAGIVLVVIQGIAAWFDGYLTEEQMASRGIIGWSFMQHGGMWADVFIISPLVAYLASKYRLPYISKEGLYTLTVVLAFAFIMGHMYRRGGMITPEAHTHDGRTTFAGEVHGIFAVAAMWVFAMVYVPGLATPEISKLDLLLVSTLLSPFFYLGVVKFSDRWVFSSLAKLQVLAELIVVWAITFLRIV